MSGPSAERERARRAESRRTPEAQEGAGWLHATDEHRTYAATRPALAAVDRGQPAAGGPLARYAFSIDPDGHLRSPRAAPLLAPAAGSTSAACTGRLEDCVAELATRQARIAKLHAAQRAESCGTTA